MIFVFIPLGGSFVIFIEVCTTVGGKSFEG